MGRIVSAFKIVGLMALLLTSQNLAAQVFDSLQLDGVSLIRAPMRIVEMHFYEPLNYMPGGKTKLLDLGPSATGNITQALQAMPSMSLKRYAPGGLATPTMRGTGAGHTQVYWEGMPMNSSMLGQQDLALGAGNIFREMQALYGGNSLMLGSGGLGGALDLSSPIGWWYKKDNDQELRLRQQVGSWGNLASNAELDIHRTNFAASTRLYWNTARNNFPFSNATLPGSPRQKLAHAGIMQFGGLQAFKFAYKQNAFFAKLWVLNSDRSLPPTMLSAPTDESQADQAMRLLGGWTRTLKLAELSISGAWFREAMQYDYPSAGIHSPSQSTRIIGNADYNLRQPTGKFLLRKVGLRYMHDRASTDGYADGVQQNQLSGMVRGEWNPTKFQHLSLLIRQEMYDTKLSPILAVLGGNVGLFKQKVTLNANLTRNYRYPSLNDRFWAPGGNPNLRPELSHAAEFNLESKLPIKGVQNSLSLGGYFNHVNDWILWVPGTNAIWHPENARQVNAWGIEANAYFDAKIDGYIQKDNHLRANFSYSFNQTRDQDGYQLIYTPQHTAFAKLALKLGRWEAQYFQDWNSRRYTVADNSAYIKGFSTADLSIGGHFGREEAPLRKHSDGHPPFFSQVKKDVVDISLGLRNIWNAQFQTVAWRPMPGRSFFVRVDWTLGWNTK